jgi:hypothetical protein
MPPSSPKTFALSCREEQGRSILLARSRSATGQALARLIIERGGESARNFRSWVLRQTSVDGTLMVAFSLMSTG